MKSEEIPERQDSIELSRTSTGKYSWKIKLYYNEKETKTIEVINKIRDANNSLTKSFDVPSNAPSGNETK